MPGMTLTAPVNLWNVLGISLEVETVQELAMDPRWTLQATVLTNLKVVWSGLVMAFALKAFVKQNITGLLEEHVLVVQPIVPPACLVQNATGMDVILVMPEKVQANVQNARRVAWSVLRTAMVTLCVGMKSVRRSMNM